MQDDTRVLSQAEYREGYRGLQQTIANSSNYIISNVDAMLRQGGRKNKRKKTSESLQVREGEYINLCRFYDNGDGELLRLTTDITGEFQIFDLEFEEYGTRRLFGIYFPRENIWVSGEKEKVTGSYLRERFIKAGVRFNCNLSKREICNALENFWACEIEQNGRGISVPTKGGWYNNEFLHTENYMFQRTTCFPDIPIWKKSFNVRSVSSFAWKKYFCALKIIGERKLRFWIMCFPLISMLSTLFYEEGCPVDLYLNFITVGEINRRKICLLMQTFGREKLSPYRLDITERQIEKLLASVKDEVVMLDSCSSENDSRYRKEKFLRHALKIANIMTGKESQINEMGHPVNAGCVVLSQSWIFQKNAINFYVDEMIKTETESGIADAEISLGMETMWSEFVKYISDNMDDVRRLIRKKRNAKRGYLVEVMYDILDLFWSREGIDWKTECDFGNDLSIDVLMGEEYEGEEVSIDIFVQSVRKEIPNWRVLPKENASDSNAIVYNKYFLWFPTDIMKEILRKAGLQYNSHKILLKLKRYNFMITDNEGLTRKLQINGKRFEAYQFKKEFFERTGYLNIEEIGKETKDD